MKLSKALAAKTALALALSGVAVSAATFAATTPSTTNALETCMATAVSTLAMNACQETAFAAEDATMNARFASVVAREPADQAAKLEASQALFVKFRKADCDVYFGSRTGTVASVDAGACLIDRTTKRIAELGNFVETH